MPIPAPAKATVSASDGGEGYAVAAVVIAFVLGLGILAWLLKRRAREREAARRFSRALQLAGNEISSNKEKLQARRAALTSPGSFGILDQQGWYEELNRFCRSQVIPALARQGLSGEWPLIESTATSLIELAASEPVTEVPSEACLDGPSSFDPGMNPIEYVRHCAMLLEAGDWEAAIAAGDPGTDALAKKDGNLLFLRCKLCSQPVDETTVLDVAAGRRHHHANFAAIASNAAYSAAACQLAATNGVFLLHHDDLPTFSFVKFTQSLVTGLRESGM